MVVTTMNNNYEITFNYKAGNYDILIEGTVANVLSEIDRLLDFYRNEMEAYTYNEQDEIIERLKNDEFNVEVTDDVCS